MFIATVITTRCKLRRSETKGAVYIALLRSCKRKPTGIYKHFIPTGFMRPRNLLKKQEVRPLLQEEPDTTKGGISAKVGRKRFQAAMALTP